MDMLNCDKFTSQLIIFDVTCLAFCLIMYFALFHSIIARNYKIFIKQHQPTGNKKKSDGYQDRNLNYTIKKKQQSIHLFIFQNIKHQL